MLSVKWFIFSFPDINECHSDPCMNGATCEDGVFQYTCDCVDGYTGTHCETGMHCIGQECFYSNKFLY